MKITSLALATAVLSLGVTAVLAQDTGTAGDLETPTVIEKVELDALEPGAAAGQQLGQHRFVVSFEATTTREEALVRTTLQNEPAFIGLLDSLADQIALPQDVPVRFKNCGESNAYWSPALKEINMCYELLTGFNQSFQEKEDAYRNASKWADQVEVLLGSTAFVMLHEIGHGMVDLFELPVTGREEDAVDQFATFLLLAADEPGQPLQERSSRLALLGAYFFESWLPIGVEVNPRYWADTHTFGAKRSIDIMCLLMGAAPETYADVVVSGAAMLNSFYHDHPEFIVGRENEWIEKTDDLNLVPFSRSNKCAQEYARYSGGWKYLIETFMTPQAN
ncbi:DUF4344 domain-containing metallopeptidase [Devosia sp. MC1541]|uniref:DUF4344 domain-containing metallopeptidase n=1 Tax=Devosia sp. MC1541 TaxID=2725264 RepID=UPI00145E78DF|nr:DUF4344 domain-containing metallopeptidase [Devosia sp. MC1541]